MATLAFSCRLFFFFFFFILFLFSTGSHGSRPTISHSREPFALSKPIAGCIKKELYSLVQIVTLGRLEEDRKIEHKATCKSEVVTIRLRMLEWHYLMVNSTKWGRKEGIDRGFVELLEEISSLLKLRYEWAVTIDGPLWLEYSSLSNQSSSIKATSAIRNTAAAVDEEEAEDGDRKESCLPRGDVLISHNGGVGGIPSMDVLRAPRSLISQNNQFFLMMQGDCNLVLYATVEGLPLWNSGSRGRGTQCSLRLLHDATLAIYDGPTQHQVWNTSSSLSSCTSSSSVFMLTLQNDGNVVTYDLLNGLPMWATGTNQ